MEDKLLITNIQRFSVHDGPGIRTTIFLKGCSLRCPWCSNPENLIASPQPYTKDSTQGIYGKYYGIDELTEELLRDKAYYDGKLNSQEKWCISDFKDFRLLPGGVTFSGGECLLQMPVLSKVCACLRAEGVHTAVETCLFVPRQNLELSLANIDLFYVDIKILDADVCKAIEKGEIALYLGNLDRLLTWMDEQGRRKPVIARIPVIGGYTDSNDNIEQVYTLLQEYKDAILKVELIMGHNLGASKYESLGLDLPQYNEVRNEFITAYEAKLSAIGIPVEVCKI